MTEIKVGDTFSAWEVIELSAPKYIRNGKGKPRILTPYWKCVCHCGYCDGIIREVSQKNLLAGKSNGCGRKSRIENGKNNKKTNEYIKIDDEFYCITPRGNILIDEESIPLLKPYFWNLHFDTNNGYGRAYHSKDINGKKKFIFIHNLIVGNMNKDLVVDHIDGNTLNNKKTNLRICRQRENMKNLKLYSNNKSGYKGVCYSKIENKWKAYITVNKKKIHLGTFLDKELAIKKRLEAEVFYFREFNRKDIDKNVL